MEGIVSRIRNDEEIKAMRKEWNENIKDKQFPLFHFESYIGIEDYKEKVRAELDRRLKERD